MLTSSLVGSVLLGSHATQLVGTIGSGIIIKTITTTTSSITALIGYLSKSDHPNIPELINQLDDIDLDFTINIIGLVVKEQETTELPESINMALVGVNDILILIHKELDEIKSSIELHSNKYLSGWRSFACHTNISSIKKHYNQLERRYKLLFELIKVAKK